MTTNHTIDEKVFWIKGSQRSLIYDLRCKHAKLYWLDEEATQTLLDFLKNKQLSQKQKSFIHLIKSILKLNQFNIKDFKPPKSEIKINFAWIEITNKCNLKCIHCYGNFTPSNVNFLTTSDFLNILEQLEEINCKNIQIIGGEPLLHPDIWNFLQHSIKRGFKTEIFTNGLLITEDIVQKLRKLNIQVALSWYGSKEEATRITQNTLFSEKVWNSIELLKKFQIPFRIATIITKYNERASNPLGGKIDIVRISGRASLQLLNIKLIRRKFLRLENFYRPISSEFILSNMVKHNCFGRKLYIDAQLNVYPCVMERRISYGNLIKKKLTDILKDNIRWLKLTKDFIEGCSNCEFRYACFDCRPDSLSEDIHAKPWYCLYEPNKGTWCSERERITDILKYFPKSCVQ